MGPDHVLKSGDHKGKRLDQCPDGFLRAWLEKAKDAETTAAITGILAERDELGIVVVGNGKPDEAKFTPRDGMENLAIALEYMLAQFETWGRTKDPAQFRAITEAAVELSRPFAMACTKKRIKLSEHLIADLDRAWQRALLPEQAVKDAQTRWGEDWPAKLRELVNYGEVVVSGGGESSEPEGGEGGG